MSEPRWIWQCDHVIPSQPGAGRNIRQDVLRQLHQANWGQHDVFSIHLALEEALVNAIRHGNRFDVKKRVHVCCKMAPDRIWIEISDEGPGFNPQTVPDCTAAENLEVPSGRGLKLMRCFMNRVEYNPQGNCVVMEKIRATGDEA